MADDTIKKPSEETTKAPDKNPVDENIIEGLKASKETAESLLKKIDEIKNSFSDLSGPEIDKYFLKLDNYKRRLNSLLEQDYFFEKERRVLEVIQNSITNFEKKLREFQSKAQAAVMEASGETPGIEAGQTARLDGLKGPEERVAVDDSMIEEAVDSLDEPETKSEASVFDAFRIDRRNGVLYFEGLNKQINFGEYFNVQRDNKMGPVSAQFSKNENGLVYFLPGKEGTYRFCLEINEKEGIVHLDKVDSTIDTKWEIGGRCFEYPKASSSEWIDIIEDTLKDKKQVIREVDLEIQADYDAPIPKAVDERRESAESGAKSISKESEGQSGKTLEEMTQINGSLITFVGAEQKQGGNYPKINLTDFNLGVEKSEWHNGGKELEIKLKVLGLEQSGIQDDKTSVRIIQEDDGKYTIEIGDKPRDYCGGETEEVDIITADNLDDLPIRMSTPLDARREFFRRPYKFEVNTANTILNFGNSYSINLNEIDPNVKIKHDKNSGLTAFSIQKNKKERVDFKIQQGRQNNFTVTKTEMVKKIGGYKSKKDEQKNEVQSEETFLSAFKLYAGLRELLQVQESEQTQAVESQAEVKNDKTGFLGGIAQKGKAAFGAGYELGRKAGGAVTERLKRKKPEAEKTEAEKEEEKIANKEMAWAVAKIAGRMGYNVIGRISGAKFAFDVVDLMVHGGGKLVGKITGKDIDIGIGDLTEYSRAIGKKGGVAKERENIKLAFEDLFADLKQAKTKESGLEALSADQSQEIIDKVKALEKKIESSKYTGNRLEKKEMIVKLHAIKEKFLNKVEEAEFDRQFEVEKLLKGYVNSHVNALDIAKDALNLGLSAAGLYHTRALVYGLVATMKRLEKSAGRIDTRGMGFFKFSSNLLKKATLDAATDTFKQLTGRMPKLEKGKIVFAKAKRTRVEASQDIAQALTPIFTGLGIASHTVLDIFSGNDAKFVESGDTNLAELNKFLNNEESVWKFAGNNFLENLERGTIGTAKRLSGLGAQGYEHLFGSEKAGIETRGVATGAGVGKPDASAGRAPAGRAPLAREGSHSTAATKESAAKPSFRPPSGGDNMEARMAQRMDKIYWPSKPSSGDHKVLYTNLGEGVKIDGNNITFTLGKGETPKSMSAFVRLLALDHMKGEIAADGNLTVIEEARALNVGANLKKLMGDLAHNHHDRGAGGVKAGELKDIIEVGKGGHVTIKDQAGFDNVMKKLAEHATEKFSDDKADALIKAARAGQVGAVSYTGEVSNKGWAKQLELVNGDKGVSGAGALDVQPRERFPLPASRTADHRAEEAIRMEQSLLRMAGMATDTATHAAEAAGQAGNVAGKITDHDLEKLRYTYHKDASILKDSGMGTSNSDPSTLRNVARASGVSQSVIAHTMGKEMMSGGGRGVSGGGGGVVREVGGGGKGAETVASKVEGGTQATEVVAQPQTTELRTRLNGQVLKVPSSMLQGEANPAELTRRIEYVATQMNREHRLLQSLLDEYKGANSSSPYVKAAQALLDSKTHEATGFANSIANGDRSLSFSFPQTSDQALRDEFDFRIKSMVELQKMNPGTSVDQARQSVENLTDTGATGKAVEQVPDLTSNTPENGGHLNTTTTRDGLEIKGNYKVVQEVGSHPRIDVKGMNLNGSFDPKRYVSMGDASSSGAKKALKELVIARSIIEKASPMEKLNLSPGYYKQIEAIEQKYHLTLNSDLILPRAGG
ncbi:MAG: hypothetical protein COU31_00560 [Candidatus Magasanikbacteria bacterium CG10_big_fil_rev_8_21_14_0_10_40_10]|uniref:Uncharacterized protein n=1 Tax=Candidatus Magasanikbacteria bacterium CG10_big_fil_rev_8_21_14_0_10_40_10 TaxID=1974648 RepID=A0A2M6W541_9BACT|nr:MAG: hypothetical protein COU31_00560 [Candidatus Magasanikbacteria bacterium CG10_big_fil_rev_8_21_14_0_10_40_10]